MVKVRILPPQPNFPSENDGIGGVGCFYTRCYTRSSGPISLFPIQNEVSTKGGNGNGVESRSGALDAGKKPESGR
jgi:hypothetical protein